ncbi:MAG: hypothetical protein JJU06_14665 [Ectothiorhodospiraceae bacterium]|nr:hypothetical protein [Ectothiorhodospiraceae bacterium]MCH8503001.1 hypothetical protein [Ectothiorhodospiraceae bacterium]
MSVPERYRRRDPKTGERIYPPMPDVYMPAMFPLDLARSIATALRNWATRHDFLSSMRRNRRGSRDNSNNKADRT